ncbi:MAG: CopG family transcriptional regulator [Novosphingobium sp.]
MSVKTIKADEFDRRFDEGEDMADYIDWNSPRGPGFEPKRVNVDFPAWLVDRLDKEARLRGISRQALIKTLVFEHYRKAA